MSEVVDLLPTAQYSHNEETSLICYEDPNKSLRSQILKTALEKALAIDTKLPIWIRRMRGMSGKKYRYFINNLIELTPNPRYLEVGSWLGSTACSAIYGNNAVITCIDNWSEFGGPKEAFKENVTKSLNESAEFNFIESDFRSVNYHHIGKFNIFLFDGPHDEKDQFDGIVMAQPALDEVFTLIVDDWNSEIVRNGTMKAIDSLGINIISKIDIRTTQDNSYPKLLQMHISDWHNGYLIAICKKDKALGLRNEPRI